MKNKEFIQKYEELLDSGYCECNELNCLDNNPPRKILSIMREQQEEIERLNNIINELEKWLKKESNFWKEQQEKAIEYGWLEFGGKYNTTIIYDNAINKLQELKGSE